MLFPDGVYVTAGDAVHLQPVAAPTCKELQALVQRAADRREDQSAFGTARILVRDVESRQLNWRNGTASMRWRSCMGSRSRIG